MLCLVNQDKINPEGSIQTEQVAENP